MNDSAAKAYARSGLDDVGVEQIRYVGHTREVVAAPDMMIERAIEQCLRSKHRFGMEAGQGTGRLDADQVAECLQKGIALADCDQQTVVVRDGLGRVPVPQSS